jgi:sugar phosphate isomerase/epimerase
MTPADACQHLRDRNVEVAELDALVGWLPGGSGSETWGSLPSETELYDLTASIGARLLNVVDLEEGTAPPLEESAEAFAAICDRSADYGLKVAIEFVPWTRIPDIATAWRIAELSGRANGGVMLDTWHLFRSGGTLEDIMAIPAERIFGLQISDAPEGERNARIRQHQQGRLLPGKGVIGVAEILRVVIARGCTAPIGLEVTSVDLASLAPREVMARLVSAVRTVLPWST